MTTRQLLIMQRNALIEALTPTSEDFAKFRARRMIRRIDERLLRTDRALEETRGFYGENGWAPEVERAVSLLEYRPSPTLSEPLPRTNPETQTRRAA